MIIRKSESTPTAANADSTIWDYPLPSNQTGLSFQKLSGRLPAKGWYKNTVCREIFFIIEGKGQIHIDDQHYDFAAGDVVVLEPNQKHCGEYENVSLITITSPDWYKEQCEVVEN